MNYRNSIKISKIGHQVVHPSVKAILQSGHLGGHQGLPARTGCQGCQGGQPSKSSFHQGHPSLRSSGMTSGTSSHPSRSSSSQSSRGSSGTSNQTKTPGAAICQGDIRVNLPSWSSGGTSGHQVGHPSIKVILHSR